MTDAIWQKQAEPAPKSATRIPWTRWIGGIAVVMVLLFSSHSFQFLFADDIAGGLSERPSARSNPVYAAMFAAQLSMFLFLLFFHVLNNGIRKPLVIAMAYCGYVTGSMFWSLFPGTTMVPAILFSYLVIAAFVTSSIFTPRQFLRVYFYLCAVILISSFVLLAMDNPAAGVERYGGGWLLDREFSGVMASKNFAGIVFGSATILAINGHHLGIPRIFRALVFIMGVAAAILSNSATAIVIIAVLSIPGIIFQPWLAGWKKGLFGMLLCLALVIPLLPFISAGDALSVLGRDATFTGRTYLWEVALEEFLNHPVFGHGYYAFFDTSPYSPVWNLWEKFRYFLADNFHNSFMDILISLGIVGVVVMIGTAIRAATIVGNESIEPGTRICLGLQLGVFLIGSMMEFAIFHHNYIATFFLFYVLFASMWQYEDQA